MAVMIHSFTNSPSLCGLSFVAIFLWCYQARQSEGERKSLSVLTGRGNQAGAEATITLTPSGTSDLNTGKRIPGLSRKDTRLNARVCKENGLLQK